MHDELRLVVDRPQVGPGLQRGGDSHGVDGVVEPPAGVHDGQRLVDQGVEEVRRVGEGPADPVGSHDGEAVPGQEEFGLEPEHAPEGGGPLPRVTLHLLRVPGVGRGPDEEVAAAEHAGVLLPGHGVVVGLALLVAQREPDATDRDVQRVVVGPVGVAVLGGPVQVGEAELPTVDDGVVAGGEDVAVEAGRQRVVRDDLGGGPALRRGLLLPDRHAEDVVDVPVGVDGGVEAGRAPRADVVVDHPGQRCAAGVDQDEAVPGGEGGDVGEGGAETHTVGDLDEAADVVDRMEGGGRDLAVPQAVGDGEDVRWHGPPGAAARPVRAAGSGARRLLLGGGRRRVRRRGGGRGDGGRGRAFGLPLLHALLELVFGRAEVAGELGDGRPAEEEHDENDGHDQQVGSEKVSEHVLLLHLGPKIGELGSRLDPFPPRSSLTPGCCGGIRSHPANRMPITSAATLARPPTDPQRANWPLVVARWCRNAPSPARRTTTILAMSTAFQAESWAE